MILLAAWFISTLPLWGWALLAIVPPAIISLYFLKLRRAPLEVPSTYLWKRTIEDLHVNSIWQRLRRSLLLILQLLLLLLVAIALFRPGWLGATLIGDRFIILVDNSASMSANDINTNRLTEAKKRARDIVANMKSGDVAMVISFSDHSNVVESFTNNSNKLNRAIDSIEPTNRTSDISEALRYAAGLANPGRSSKKEDEDGKPTGDVQAAEARPATLYVMSDGGFSAIPDFALGNLTPEYVKIGADDVDNLGIVAFTTDRNPERPEQMQAFARIENQSSAEVTVTVGLSIDDDEEPRDLQEVTVPAVGVAGVQFDLPDFILEEDARGELRVTIDREDNLALDNIAYAVVNPPRQARVLLVTTGNRLARLALSTEQARKVSILSEVEPAFLATDDYKNSAAAGDYDLIIFDRCAPTEPPQANTFYIGELPPGDGWKRGEGEGVPAIIDWDRIHPLMQLLEFDNVMFAEGFELAPPPGANVLISATFGPVFAIAPREGYEDAVMGMEIMSTEEGAAVLNTDWHLRLSFPVFFQNLLRYLGGTKGVASVPSSQPGDLIKIRTTAPVPSITIKPPSGSFTEIAPDSKNLFRFSGAEQLGIYDITEKGAKKVSRQFVVNLFDSRESDLRPADEITFGNTDVKAVSRWEPSRFELWRWIILAGLVLLLFEWYVFNKRVYL